MTQEANNQINQAQPKAPENQKAQKSKRHRKTLEQQLEEIKDRQQELKTALRKQEDRKKIVFGAVVISMLKILRENGDQNAEAICKLVDSFAHKKKIKDYDMIHEIIGKIMAIMPERNNKK